MNINWTQQPIVGMALLLGGTKMIDSHGNAIERKTMYMVGKIENTGQLVILKVDDEFNEGLRALNRLN